MRPLAFDLTRLIARLRHASPSGIDRVDLAYARHILAGEGGGESGRFGVLWSPAGPRVLDRAVARTVVEAVCAAWAEEADAAGDPVYDRLLAALGAVGGERVSPPARPPRRRGLRLAVRALRASRGIARLPEGTVYVNTSHMGLEHARRFDWLHDRADMRAAFFVHDLIPISHPEYGRPGEARRHARRMETVARHAAHVVVNSGDVGARFSDHVRGRGLPTPPITVAPLGVEPAFLTGEGAPPLPRPVFVVCGTIESRKNHLMLLQVWRDLARRLGGDTPRLVLVGRRGWEAENVRDLLDRCPGLRAHVHEVSGLSTPGLARLLRGATALLMPSFIEGYGLPVVEAAACGLPVVASDIAVHREVAGGFALFLDPLDGPGWARAVEDLARPGSELRARLAAGLSGYAAPGWPAHLARFEAALAALET